jgi:hypothetical protein
VATKKVASLKSTILAHKGEASPASANGDTLVKIAVKLSQDEYTRLMQLGLRSHPRRSNQKMVREAVLRYLDAEEVTTP